MKNNILYLTVLILLFFNSNLISGELEINSSKIKYDDDNQVTILEGNVSTTDEQNNKLF